jgi:hypothetical protein
MYENRTTNMCARRKRCPRMAATHESCLILVLFTASVGLSAAQCVPTSRSPRIETFATVKAVANQGEAGSALRLEETGSRVTATLRDHLGGGKLIEAHLTGALTETKSGVCRVHLFGKNAYGQVKIDGEVEITRFRGTATRQVGKEVFSHNVSLRRQLPNETPEVGFSPTGMSQTLPQVNRLSIA